MFRNRKQMGRWMAIAVAIGLLCSADAQAGKPDKPAGGGDKAPAYTVAQLDDGGGAFTNGVARALNDTGLVVGQVENAATSEVFGACWELSGSQWQLRLLTDTGDGAVAFGVNRAGEIVGGGYDADGHARAFYWAAPTAPPVTLPPVSGNVQSVARSINNAGVVCGYLVHPPVYDDDGNSLYWLREAVAWRVNLVDGQPSVFGPVPLPTLDDQSLALAITDNDSDGAAEIVGGFCTAANNVRTAAVAWTVQSHPDGSLTADPLPMIVENGDAGASGVNNLGIICGDIGFPNEAVVWSGGVARPLNPNRMALTVTQGINDAGVIVGYGGTGIVDHEAVVWPSASAKPVALSKYLGRTSPFLFLKEALAINQAGDIVGFGWDGENYGAFLAVPK